MTHFFRSSISLAFVTFSLICSYAQNVTKKVIVEHFTNTRCSVCASRNPGFYSALNQNPEVIHIAYHPSSPYSTCLFSIQNKIQNDARTNYYGIYGGTPRFIINGEEKTGTEVQSATIYNESKSQTTPVELKVSVSKFGSDQIEVAFDVKAMTNNTVGTVNYFVALVEDVVLYDAPNGEKIHHDVFRKSSSSSTTLPSFIVPANAGNVLNFKDKIKIEPFWDLSKIYAIVILTDANKKVVQVAESALFNPNVLSSADDKLAKENLFSLSPNPVTLSLNIQYHNNKSVKNIVIYDTMGQEMLATKSNQENDIIDVSKLPNGTYLLQVKSDNATAVRKFIKI
ncbi:MAG: T9SS type A sorting domain-containing protein [Saprospiraceae bacterium]|jgi:hypothetical protein|nr:T9SS type A sorting domain-containing protein [Saprospiraceae bacterium]